MAKETVLICDLCLLKRDAVATLVLSNEGVIKSELDVCKGHRRHLFKIFTARKRHTTVPPISKGRKPSPLKGKMLAKLNVPAFKKWIMEQKEPFTAMDMARKFKIAGNLARKWVIDPMIASGEIKATGKHRNRKLMRA